MNHLALSWMVLTGFEVCEQRSREVLKPELYIICWGNVTAQPAY